MFQKEYRQPQDLASPSGFILHALIQYGNQEIDNITLLLSKLHA